MFCLKTVCFIKVIRGCSYIFSTYSKRHMKSLFFFEKTYFRQTLISLHKDYNPSPSLFSQPTTPPYTNQATTPPSSPATLLFTFPAIGILPSRRSTSAAPSLHPLLSRNFLQLTSLHVSLLCSFSCSRTLISISLWRLWLSF